MERDVYLKLLAKLETAEGLADDVSELKGNSVKYPVNAYTGDDHPERQIAQIWINSSGTGIVIKDGEGTDHLILFNTD